MASVCKSSEKLVCNKLEVTPFAVLKPVSVNSAVDDATNSFGECAECGGMYKYKFILF